MRLLNASTIKLEEFMAKTPPYAILSHTWGEGEVLFSDVQNSTAQCKTGYAKILESCRLTMSQGYDYIWIDTCCIDKSSSAELSEAINSMYAYYEDSATCYVYLDIDLPSGDMTAESLRKARWTHRGWTLQELIAPHHVELYDTKWIFLGTRAQCADVLANVTNVHPTLLNPSEVQRMRLGLHHFSIADRMSWVGDRQTTRPEDIAYCLFGIFNVHLPPLYGEGATKAFLRLQEEIMRSSTDLSLLAWSGRPYPHPSASSTRALAQSPTWFKGNVSIGIIETNDVDPFKMTNKGLRVRLPMIQDDLDEDSCTVVLRSCGFMYIDKMASEIGVRLRRMGPSKSPVAIEQGRSIWQRDNRPLVNGVPAVHPVDATMMNNAKIHKIYIYVR